MAVPWLVVGLSLGSALAFAASTNLKHSSAAELPSVHRFRAGTVARFVTATLSHRLWLAGIMADGIGLSLQVIALHLGALAVVQPLLISGMLFALLLRRRRGRPVTTHEVRWALVLTGCLVAFLFLAGTNPVDSKSVLVTKITSSSQGERLEWNTTPGLMFQVQTSTDFKTWSDVGSPRFAADNTDSIPITGEAGSTFFRILRVR